MNQKVVFLMYGVFAVGSNYQVKAQVISTLCGDVTPAQDKYASENLSQFVSDASERMRMNEANEAESNREHSKMPATRNEDWQENSGLVYYCRFSANGLKKLVC